MTWSESNIMDERLKFVARMLDGEKMAGLCREFGISRKTGYKIWERYKDIGIEGLHDRSRRPYRHANQLPFQVERAILQIKQEYPSWGAPKIREKGKIAYYYDAQVSGLGIMLFPSGTKTFFVYKRVNGRPDKIKLGRFPQMAVEQARKAAYSIINEIDKGIDPKLEKSKIAKEMLFSELFNEFMEKHSKLHKKSWRFDEDKYRLHLSHFAKRRIGAISKADIIQLHSSLAKTSGLYSANRVLGMLATMFNKAIEWGWEGINPCIGIKKFKEKSRERFIQGDEITKFFKSLNEEPN